MCARARISSGAVYAGGEAAQALPTLRGRLPRQLPARRRPVHPWLEREAPGAVHLAGTADPSVVGPHTLGCARKTPAGLNGG